jgi:hypothetical protein
LICCNASNANDRSRILLAFAISALAVLLASLIPSHFMSTSWRFSLAILTRAGFLSNVVYQIQGRALTGAQAVVVGYAGLAVCVAFWTGVLYAGPAIPDHVFRRGVLFETVQVTHFHVAPGSTECADSFAGGGQALPRYRNALSVT